MPDIARSWLSFSPAVAQAQAAGRPLVALESTIIAHGMPYPENVRTAREVESLIRGIVIQSGNDACVVLAEGLATETELHETIEALAAFTEDPRSLISLPRVFQVTGRAPA